MAVKLHEKQVNVVLSVVMKTKPDSIGERERETDRQTDRQSES